MTTNNKQEEIVNPNEFLAIPKWINEDYFLPILEKDVTNFKRIIKFKPVAATAPGENYTSIMVRVIIEVELYGELLKFFYDLMTKVWKFLNYMST